MISCQMTKQHHEHDPIPVQETLFDSDSVPLSVDNRASASITTSATDFIDTPKPVRYIVNRISGNMVP